MPFIDLKISISVPDEKKEKIVAELGKNISIMNKPESYLMIGIVDNYHLWFGGKKLKKEQWFNLVDLVILIRVQLIK
jgi:phenylpyruvate tautomerase PptA (4-oxalocrotonate tautomerase family)